MGRLADKPLFVITAFIAALAGIMSYMETTGVVRLRDVLDYFARPAGPTRIPPPPELPCRDNTIPVAWIVNSSTNDYDSDVSNALYRRLGLAEPTSQSFVRDSATFQELFRADVRSLNGRDLHSTIVLGAVTSTAQEVVVGDRISYQVTGQLRARVIRGPCSNRTAIEENLHGSGVGYGPDMAYRGFLASLGQALVEMMSRRRHSALGGPNDSTAFAGQESTMARQR